MREAAVATAMVVLAVATLGTDWTGVEVTPGVWRDSVTPGRWALFSGALVLLGLVTGHWLRTWPRRLAAAVPVLAWLAWQLRIGTLWPIALALYGSGILAAWLIGCALSRVLARGRGR